MSNAFSGYAARFGSAVAKIIPFTFLLLAIGCPDEGADHPSMRRTAGITPEIETASTETVEGASTQMWMSLNSARSVLRAKEQEAVARNHAWAGAVTAALDAVDWQPRFTESEGASPAMDKLAAALDGVEGQGLKPESCGVEQFKAARTAFAESAGQESGIMARLQAMTGWAELSAIVDRPEKPTAEEIGSLPDGVRDLKKKQIAALVEGVGELAAARKATAAARADAEVAATLSYLQYAMNMRFRIVASPFLAQRNPDSAHDAFKDKLVESFKAFVDSPDETLAKLPPQHPYYRKIVDGLAAYRKMAEEGEFPEVNVRSKLNPGVHGGPIEGIKKRLAREGYFSGTIDGKFDADMKKAVELYQTNHGFNPTGIIDPALGKSMNVPLERRIEQIELSLQRWRESEVRDGGEIYVRVNIPEFKMEVWQEDERIFKNRVVVGNNNWDTDPLAKVEGRINRTKMFTAEIQDVVLNPRWNVPLRIRQVELEMDLLSQPDYLLKNNYVVEMLPDGREIVYQKAGDDNALGRIKFNFPNKYGIFMHDTNLKSYFGREIRAFSHGCVRLDDPVPVAKYFLKLASDVTEEDVDRELQKREPDPRSVKLSRPIPITIEYNSVGPDDDGLMMFFSDVYGYDKDFFAGKIPYSAEELKLLQRKVTQSD